MHRREVLQRNCPHRVRDCGGGHPRILVRGGSGRGSRRVGAFLGGGGGRFAGFSRVVGHLLVGKLESWFFSGGGGRGGLRNIHTVSLGRGIGAGLHNNI